MLWSPCRRLASTQPASHFLFLRLPLEIQIMLLKQLLLDKREHRRKPKSMTPSGTTRVHYGVDLYGQSRGQLIGLFLTCKAIYKEVIPIYYGENDFWFHGFAILGHFPQSIGPEKRTLIKGVALELEVDNNATTVQGLAGCTSLSHLTLVGNCGSMSPNWKAKRKSSHRSNLLQASRMTALRRLSYD
ncbi:hypothetical protein BJ875DRAFT_520426 [Amylocarpus encephaloides]|uniref:DUF7730 domain-containing protein n=1 Tax=Amylocarpus encephaloides TaxID=45428 RepID=A0A9P8C1I8_9HELO|nr:hypothetical protein BJ875DRAFT_520426 [Amylocarpus encephaloides]